MMKEAREMQETVEEDKRTLSCGSADLLLILQMIVSGGAVKHRHILCH